MTNIWLTISNLFQRIKTWIVTLNLFDTRVTDERTIKVEKWSTRVYLILLFAILITLTTYTGVSDEITTMTVPTPTLKTFLDLFHSKHASTLKCPCSLITINHGDFVQVNYTLHPICSSEFVTNRTFRKLLFDTGFGQRTDYQRIWPMEIRKSLTPYLSLLSSACHLTTITLADTKAKFDSQPLIISEVLSPDVFDSQVLIILNRMRDQAPVSFLRSLDTIQSIASSNQIISGWATNYLYNLNDLQYYSVSYSFASSIHSWCDCLSAQKCPVPMGFYNYSTWDTNGYYNLTELKPNLTITGFFSDCLPVDGALVSSLACFYNHSCVKSLEEIFNLTMPVPLNASQLHSNEINDTIQTLLSRLLVDKWENQSSYSDFFQHCGPTHCSYLLTYHHGFLFILNKILGIVGGLIVTLRILIPFILKHLINWFRNHYLNKATHCQCSLQILSEFIRQKMFSLWKVLAELNLFKDDSAHDASIIRSKRIATRVYLLLLAISCVILITYNSLDSQIHTVTIDHPSLIVYEDLYAKFSSTLTCSCSQISVSNEQFLNITYILHPICSSDILFLNWTTQKNDGKTIVKYDNADFRSGVGAYFRLIDKLCSLCRTTIEKSLESFYFDEFINNHLIDRISFEAQSILRVNTFVDTTTADFFTTINIVRQMTYGNHMLVASMLNALVRVNGDVSLKTDINDVFILGDDCRCCSSSSCVGQQYLKIDVFDYQRIWNIPGLLTGCSELESVLRSTLECWFEKDCLNQVIYLILNTNMTEANILPLAIPNANFTMRFSRDTPFETLLNDMLVSVWENTSSYHSFYSACLPASCTYSYIGKNTGLYIFLTTLGLLGGLSKVLRFLVPILVKNIMKYVGKGTYDQSSSRTSGDYWIGTLRLNVQNYYTSLPEGLPDDFLYRSTGFFEILKMLCDLSSDTVADEIKRFSRNDFVTAQPLSRAEFMLQTHTLLSTFESSVSSIFMQSLQLMRETNQANGFLNSYLTNWYYPSYIEWHQLQTSSDSPLARQYGNCSCAVSSDCMTIASLHFVNAQGVDSVMYPNGFVMGCDALESLLHTSFMCLFDQDCLNSLCDALHKGSGNYWRNRCPVTVLDALSTLYPLNESAEVILTRMMVDQWINKSTYTSFYDGCAPTYCTYFYTTRSTFIYKVTIVIGFYGGINVSLRFLLPIGVKIFLCILAYITNYRHHRSQVQPMPRET
ncbi:hypothetical protein I4U23_016729 [Adineta vaga]|nr:hypothetical protein I4U23_016729 [Adineta vaga]